MKKLLIAGIAALFLATGTAHALDVVDGPRGERDNRKWVWRCSFPHTPSEERWKKANSAANDGPMFRTVTAIG